MVSKKPRLVKFIYVYLQDLLFQPITKVYMTFRSKVLSCTKKYDGQTDGLPKPIGPKPFGLGPNKRVLRFSK